ncbi:phosphatidate cytidylyltransferase [Sinorhizobium sp. BG8]|uniref:phosphatidate cytidylyltransferase n=1 Tax=Sinorhizobium sp. BG8 TaxID=2613773 RepID=UPI00193D5370|nr:phosphatidate cytidylyltransferase [Sinorhizobium sp. BG8]QRM55540.1 phosphatidate cytidylyltransferase [Sinorhizobium sp. BG8]
MQKELRLRIGSGIVLAIVVLVATWFGGLAFKALAVAISLLVYHEWSSMTRLAETDFRGNAFGWASVAAAGLSVLLDSGEWGLGIVLVSVATSTVYSIVNGKDGWLPGGVAYAGLTALSLAEIRGNDMTGLIAMLFVFAVVWGTDILAYFVGRAVGGPKLAPRISPGKTWSGAIGGLVSAVIAGTALYSVFFPLTGLWVPFMAVVLSAFSQIGDLFESFVKRRCGVKDSGRLIPGHGGVMDRVDGLVFACFAAFMLGLAQALLTDNGASSIAAFVLGL